VEKDEGIRVTAGLLQLSQGLEERLRQAVRRDAPPIAVVPPRDASPAEVRERRFLAMAMALPDAAKPYLASLPPDAFQMDGHRAAFEAIRAAERRAAGDEAGRLEALDLARRVRAALRGER
jgi:hypothetical protein